ncbi:MAG: LysR substrate-binding domain-containing protein [Pseudorhodoplanes sp.]|nr:LysR substrate-binding domain-containing protein [Pseudorhodoplanes sp.]
MCRRARLVLAEIRLAGEEVRDLKEGFGGRVAVGSLLAASARLLPEAIARLRRARPKVSVHVVEGTNDVLMPALRIGELDLVVGRLSEFRERAALRQEVLYDEITCLVVRPGHPLLQRPEVALADTLEWDFILPRPETTLRRQLEKAFHDEGLEPPPARVESVSVLTNRHLAMETDAISVWPHQVVRRDLLDGLLVRLPLQLWQASGPVGVTVRSSGPTTPAAAALLDELRAVAATDPPGAPRRGDIHGMNIQFE